MFHGEFAQSQPEAGPSTPRTHARLSPSPPPPTPPLIPLPDEDDDASWDGYTSYNAEQSILHPDATIPSCLDRNSAFFHVLTAPYRLLVDVPLWKPPVVAPRDGHAARCAAMVQWAEEPRKKGKEKDEDEDADSASSSASTSSSLHPVREEDRVLYAPHGRWEWTHGLPIDEPRQLLILQSGAQCSASIDSGTIAGREIKYICRKWDTTRQKEWEGFYSELGLYKSEQYLRPLQGDVVPHLIGVHIMPRAVSVTMELPHASFWIESSPSMPNVLKERVIAAFEKIHARGVLHGDPELRHMLIGADGRVMIIDFGMSRAMSQNESVGIERAEREEFRLEMRKVKYKLDYMGARKKETDKTDDYMRRIEKNERLAQMWARRRAGERTGPITEEFEEDPEEYNDDPPVNAEDLEEDWNAGCDDEPVRVVVPGQSEVEVAREVEAFMKILRQMSTTAQASSSKNPPPYPCYPSPWTSSGRVHMWYSDDPEDAEVPLPPQRRPVKTSTVVRRIKEHNLAQFRRYGLPHPKLVASGEVTGGKGVSRGSLGNMVRRREAEVMGSPYVSIVEKAAIRRKYMRVKRMKNGHIAKLAGGENMSGIEIGLKEMAEIDFGEGRGNLKDVPEGPRILQEEEYRMITETRRQAVVRYSKAPKGILKRRREDEGFSGFEQPTNPVGLYNPIDGVAVHQREEEDRPVRKKIRSCGTGEEETLPAAPIGRRPGEMLGSGWPRRKRDKRVGRPEGVSFTLPSVRTVSTLIGTLMAWTG